MYRFSFLIYALSQLRRIQFTEVLNNGVLSTTEVHMPVLKFFILSHVTFKKCLF